MEWLIVLWIICGIIGSVIGSQKEAAGKGFWLGLLLGPIGIAIALGVDSRPCCPNCGTRLNGRPLQCPQCQTRFQNEFCTPADAVRTALAQSAAAHNSNLLPCPDCGNQISRLAQACPNCGRPMKDALVASPLPSSPFAARAIPQPPPPPLRRRCVDHRPSAFFHVAALLRSAGRW